MLLIAIVLIIAIGLAHSYLGERYILIRLFRQTLPKLFGDDSLTKQTLRFTWHLLTVAWFGFAALLYQVHAGQLSTTPLLSTVGSVFGITAIIALAASRAKHLSWIVFLAIAVICHWVAWVT